MSGHSNVIQLFNQIIGPLEVEAVMFSNTFHWLHWTLAEWSDNGLHVYISLHATHRLAHSLFISREIQIKQNIPDIWESQLPQATDTRGLCRAFTDNVLDYRPAVTWFADSKSVFDLTLEFVWMGCLNSFTARVEAKGRALMHVGWLPMYFKENAWSKI